MGLAERMAWVQALQLLAVLFLVSQVDAQGFWEVVVENAGIASMHTAVTHYGTVVLLDRTNIGPSQLALNNGRCRDNPADRQSTHDCTAHSAELTPGPNTIRPLFVFTDTWCSSGQFAPDGTLVQTGGDADGFSKIRTFQPCGAGGMCDWVETTTDLQEGRWYATNQLLPDGTSAVVGGRAVFTVEYVPANGRGTTNLPLLTATDDAEYDNLYPFVHLLPNNKLFIFANRDSCLYDWTTNTVTANFPTIPGEPRNYPSGGSSVLLPLVAANGWTQPEVLICGGAQLGAYNYAAGQYTGSITCGRMKPLDAAPGWAMENMPTPRIMGDMVILPTLDVLIINGAKKGSQGWGFAEDPITTPVLYHPYYNAGTRMETMTSSAIARVYHSTANLLPDGRVLVAGSNTHQFYTLTGYLATELRIEAFSPPYLEAGARPAFTAVPGALAYGEAFTATVTANAPAVIQLNLMSAPFVTHSYSMGQRLLQLQVSAPANVGAGAWSVNSVAPPTAQLAPSTYYMLFAVADGVPSQATWVKIG